MATEVTYDSTVVVRFAERLYARATASIWLLSILGVLVGMGCGAGTGEALKVHGDGATILFLVSAAIGGLLGLAVGQERAFALRLQAQTALCQLQIEFNTRRMPSEKR